MTGKSAGELPESFRREHPRASVMFLKPAVSTPGDSSTPEPGPLDPDSEHDSHDRQAALLAVSL